MKKIGIISYNIYGNFTNYGSALQSWALSKVLEKNNSEPGLIDYCPSVHLDKDILNPLEKMWDQDEDSIRNTKLSLSAIKENYYKFESFFTNQFNRTKTKYNFKNFDEIKKENLDGFICGSDTIFCIDESKGFDDGFFANYPIMQKKSIAYAASFGDTNLSNDDYLELNEKLKNFRAIGLRENKMIEYISSNVNVPVHKTIDPTLLLEPSEYDIITSDRLIKDKYLLLYSRRYNSIMEKYAENIAKKNGWKVVEISLRATNSDKGHIMMYNAGVEEFLSLVKNAEYVVTNSFHGLMFSVQFKKDFVIFSRQTGDSKINEALELFDLSSHLFTEYKDELPHIIDYDRVHNRIRTSRNDSLAFLQKELDLL